MPTTRGARISLESGRGLIRNGKGWYESVCYSCGEEVDEDDAQRHHDQVYCESCFDEELTQCYQCGDYELDSDGQFVGDEFYCNSCVEIYFLCCDACSRLIYVDDIVGIAC